MASFKKILAVSFISASLIVVPIRSTRAIVPLIIPWLLVGSNLLVTDLVVGQVGILAALFWWDCNKFALSAPCTTKTPIPAAQLPKPSLTVNLQPDAKRENPNPAKFNDPAPGKRDVTPKQTIAASGKGPPPTAQGIPGVPIGPGDIGVLTQAPRESNVGVAGVDPAVQLAQYNGSVSRSGPVTGIEVVPQKAPAPPKAIPFIALHTTCAATSDCVTAIRANEQYLRQYNGGKYINTAVIDCCTGASYKYVSIAYLYDQATDVTLACDSGYTGSGKDVNGNYRCSLTDATEVKKPLDTTCEMLFDPATKQIMTDPANPGCAGIESTSSLSVPGSDGKSSIDVKANAGNGFDVCINKANGGKTCFDTGVYDPGTGGYVIVHTTVTPPPDPNNGLGCGGQVISDTTIGSRVAIFRS
ncbi:hypothetical protein [Janthinobacterium sp. J1-1]|uniref:hypothetical protein n=1 Tax=Janthinobacterium sp. J1-1 TaxID=3065910 RepID=UPI00281104D4|nr:hypothetical protein [Janthinobacterium sp. J1-1]